MRRLILVTAFLAIALSAALSVANLQAAEFEARSLTSKTGFVLQYRLLIPEGYDSSKSYPLVMFLHGGQQRANFKWTAATRTGAMFAGSDQRQAKEPCFVLVPWSSMEYNWGSVFEGGPSPSALASVEVIDALEKEFNIDKQREYITGLSGGGKGTWGVILSHPGRFAAAIPLCARQAYELETADLPKTARRVKDLPLWLWHGAKDPQNDPENSRQMYKALQEAGGNARYTEVPDAPHNCWDTAYASDELHQWLFAQRLPASVSTSPEARAARCAEALAADIWETAPIPEELLRSRAEQGQGRAAQAVAQANSESIPAGDWTAHGFTEEEREKIRAAFRRGIEQESIPGGSLLLIHRGEAIFREAFGVADLETKKPFTVENPCFIASVTKPHTATVLAMLADQGKLSLSDPVSKYLPDFANLQVAGKGPASHCPTIAECLSHTAGFPGNNDIKAEKFVLDWSRSLAEVVSELATKPLVTDPGTAWAYTRLGFMTAGRIAEIVSGKPFHELMREMLLEPVGAINSMFYPTEEMMSRAPTPYQRTPDGLKPREGERPQDQVINPGGGLFATLDGVGRVLLLHRNHGKVDGRQLISTEGIERMYVAQPGSQGTGYGLGLNVLKKRDDGSTSRVMHIGASGTLVLMDFDQDLLLVILTQVAGQDLRWRQQLLREIDSVFGS